MTETPRELQQSRRIRELLNRVAELEDRVLSLEELMREDVPAALVDGLTRTESVLLGFLMKRDRATKAQIMSVLYADRPNGVPEAKIVDVFICKLRRKLSPLGIEIRTEWGVGYSLTSDAKSRIGDLAGRSADAPPQQSSMF